MKKTFIKKNQTGQTLIETLAALFILVMGISASVGLAIYAFGTSQSIVKQIIATGLAREGLEAVRNMRDTNWLKDTLAVNSCYNFKTAAANQANCYVNWLGVNGASVIPFCLNPSNGSSCNGNLTTSSYILGFDSTAANFWSLKAESANYGLNLDASNSGNLGFYYPGAGNNGISCVSGSSEYCRRIVITKLTPSGTPYDPASSGNSNQPGPLLQVQAQVWWTDKKCPKVNTYTNNMPCSVSLETYLTNWKN